MSNTAEIEYTVGQLVKYSRPQNPAEVAARFHVLEFNGDRILIRLICDMYIRPTECIATSEVEPA